MHATHFRPVANRPARQHGIVLITALVLMVMLTLVVLTSLSVSLASIGISKNVDNSLAAKAAAQDAIEGIITNPAFLRSPTTISTTAYSIDGDSDGTAEYAVSMRAACVGGRLLPVSELNSYSASDLACQNTAAMNNSGIVVSGGNSNQMSVCGDTRWNIRAVATRSNVGARGEINQGVSVRLPADDMTTYCR